MCSSDLNEGVKYRPVDPSLTEDSLGFQSLEILYGLGFQKNSIVYQRQRYGDQIPSSILPIGEAPGGNLICLGKNNSIYFWNHEDSTGSLNLIASSFKEFLELLVIDDNERGNTDCIIEEESWLDF